MAECNPGSIFRLTGAVMHGERNAAFVAELRPLPVVTATVGTRHDALPSLHTGYDVSHTTPYSKDV